jgi:hypothetical protein
LAWIVSAYAAYAAVAAEAEAHGWRTHVGRTAAAERKMRSCPTSGLCQIPSVAAAAADAAAAAAAAAK